MLMKNFLNKKKVKIKIVEGSMYKATLQVYSLFSICISDGFEVQ